MDLIVATGQDWGIGKDGGLMVENPVDMKYFREKTAGGVVVMGRKTLESFPDGKPLKNRVNIVLTRNTAFAREGVITAHSAQEVRELAGRYEGRQVWIIGGEQIYRMFLDDCTRAYVTRMRQSFPADTWFPNLDQAPDWVLAKEGEEQEYAGMRFAFCVYEKRR